MKTKATKLGILKTYRDNQRYEKPSEIRIRKAKEGKINLYKAKKKREQEAQAYKANSNSMSYRKIKKKTRPIVLTIILWALKPSSI